MEPTLCEAGVTSRVSYLTIMLSCNVEKVFSWFIESLKGEQIWHIPVKIVEQLQVNLDICAIPVEMRPSAVFAASPRRIPDTCVGINWQP